MARIYRIPFVQVSVSAAQDLVQLNGATGKMVMVLRAWVQDVDTTLPGSQMLAFRMRRLLATVTNGSGGSTITPVPNDNGDAAASSDAWINNTTKATTSGTAQVIEPNGQHIYNGFNELLNPNDMYPGTPISVNEAFVFELLNAPAASATVTLSGGVEYAEIGG